jgi:CRP/FNR family cyclic AMP-dependent transcriptional regulator
MSGGEAVDHRSYLGRLEPADREFLLRLGRPRRFGKGARIIVQGDHSDSVFVTLSGLTKVTLDTPDGREVVLAVLGAGDLLGEFEVIEGNSQRAAGNVAMQPVECREIPGEEFMDALATRPQMLLVLVRVVLSRLGAADRRREASASMGAARSLASFLVELVERYGTPDGSAIDLNVQLTQEELASLISTSRDTAVRGLSMLRTRGLIATRRRQIVVTDLEGLRHYASGTRPASVVPGE